MDLAGISKKLLATHVFSLVTMFLSDDDPYRAET